MDLFILYERKSRWRRNTTCGKQREKNHIKDLVCICTKLECTTKNLEVRYCDNFQEMMNKAIELRPKYYT